MYCIKCGKQIPNDGEFCPYCGRKTPNLAALPDEPEQIVGVTQVSTEGKDNSDALKKIALAIIIVLAILIVALVVSKVRSSGQSGLSMNNSTPSSEMYVINGAYNMTPQQYIDRINELVENENDSRYKTIPDYDPEASSIRIVSVYLEVSIDTNDDGYITAIEYSWETSSKSVQTAATYLVGMTICLLAPDDAEAIVDHLDMTATGYPIYDTSYVANGTDFVYSAIVYGKYNTFTVAPEGAED